MKGCCPCVCTQSILASDWIWLPSNWMGQRLSGCKHPVCTRMSAAWKSTRLHHNRKKRRQIIFFLVLLKKKTLFYLIDIDFFTLYSLLIDSVSTSVRSLPSSNRILWNSQHLSIEPAFHFDQITLGAITNWLEVNLKLNFTTSWPQRRISSMQSFPSYTWLPNVTLNNGQLWSIARWIGNVLEPRSRTACLEFYIAASIGNILTISYIWLIISS